MGFLRGAGSFVLIVLGASLSLFSAVAAFGWDRGPLSVMGTTIAIMGLSLIFLGYWLVRNMDGGPLAAACLKLALGTGSALVVVGVLAAIIHPPYFPTLYFFLTGSLCSVSLFLFRQHRSRS
jgi:energy-converting hydrogenase Eha subunit E